ncbi:helix-turn-helix domain-containing protein [Streptomyces phage Dagobah]|nr:helix-turn-helix domain-containing protein [Streptomyces phage Dagobah]
MPEQLAKSAEVAEYLQVSIKTLERWASKGGGPRYARIGHHRRYDWEDVRSWLAERQEGGRK